MKCHVYAFYNKKVNAYEKPVVNNFGKDDFCTLVRRDVLVSDNDAKEKMKECDLYYLGQYDDEKGVFETLEHPEYLFAIGQLIEGKKVGDDNA